MRCYVTIAFLAVIAVAISGCSQDTTRPFVPVEAHMDDLIETQASGPPGLRVIPPNASPHGRTYAEWSAAWWAWLWSAPVDVNPGLDETGENITYGQSGNVWFLAPAYFGTYERSATIPSGKMLFVDLAGWFNSPRVSDHGYETEEDLRAEIAALTDQITNIILEVDGTRLEHVENFRVQTPPGFMEYTLPEDNMFTYFGYPTPAGTYNDGVADGYYVMLQPLSVGDHLIFMSAELGPDFVVEVTVHLTVVGRGQFNMSAD